jgi:hypothetical protein
MYRTKSIRQCFEERIELIPFHSCWEWIGRKDKDGYGTLCRKYPKSRRHKMLKAHRISYELYKGSIPIGACVMHSCDNPSCANPNHLSIGTIADNIQDMVSKKRHSWKNRKAK